MNDTPFSTSLYRYFFFDWLFKDVHQSTGLERALAVHHNRRQARWLPCYMLRWLWLCLIFYSVAGLCELGQFPDLARWLYAGSALCLSFGVMVATAWVGLVGRQQSH